MKVFATFLFVLLFYNMKAQTGSLLTEDFTNYNGTSTTVPAGWYFSDNGNYTTSTYSGASGPNAYRFGVTAAEIISPAFQNADSIRFWLKGAGTDTISYLSIYESADSITWTPVAVINPIPLPATVFHFPLNNTSIHLRMVYTKSVGNVSLDDLEIFSTPNNPNGKIITYFTKPVDTTVGFAPHAQQLNQLVDDTLVEYINRSLYSLDIAVYNFGQNTNLVSIANAVNNAFNRGVVVRWIYNGSSTNAGIGFLNPAIQTLVSPTTSSYGLMHNKFMIIDANSPNPSESFVWTGSMNWEEQSVNSDYNNVVILQDQQLAKAYTREFNQLWGGSGPIPNITLARFGPTKFENNIHRFIIGGRTVDLYFSPAQNVNAHIISSINSASTDLYFGLYAFTLGTTASAIKSRIQNGVYAAGIMDQFCLPYAADDTLTPVMGNMLKIFSLSNLYHNKYLLIDFSDTLSDPLVLTGSHNWTTAADTKNDENTLIIHDPFIVSQFYEAFYADFSALGGQLSVEEESGGPVVSVYPNPASEVIMINTATAGEVFLFDISGSLLHRQHLNGNSTEVSVQMLSSGFYLVQVITPKGAKVFLVQVMR